MEEWRKIPSAPGYEASSLGRVRSRFRVLKLQKNTSGYLQFQAGLNGKTVRAHRAVMEAFLGASEMQVNHKNSDRTDNRLENLEYCTPKENTQHAASSGRLRGGGAQQLSRDDVALLRFWGSPRKNYGILGKIFGLKRTATMNVIYKKTYGFYAISFFCLFLSGCPKREEILAHIWLQSGLPAAVCSQAPDAAKSGIYRRLNDDQCPKGKAPPCYEFISYCNPQVRHYLSIQDQEFNDMLDKYLPRRSEKP